LSGEQVPVWIGDYVLAGYGTGAVMAVPCGDERDHAFANFFAGQEGMPAIKNIFDGVDISEEAYAAKDKTPLCNSDFLNGMSYKQAMAAAIAKLEEVGAGKGKTNYRLRDAVFSRQRYWGEPFPVYYKDGLPQMIDRKYLPIELPEVDEYLPTEDGAPPLGRATTWSWCTQENKVVSNEDDRDCVYPLELNTMPGWAGSSWYMFRYMDANNEGEMFSKEAQEYWENVDLYIGGSEHATGHLLYSRFWVKLLHDLGKVSVTEPFQKMINQGMILGQSAFVYRWEYGIEEKENRKPVFFSHDLIVKAVKEKTFIDEISDEARDVYDKLLSIHNGQSIWGSEASFNHFTPIHVDLSVIDDITNELDIEKFKNHVLNTDFKDALFVLSVGKYFVGREVEKMSKSKYNVVSPDDICDQYGADTLRLYEMFLGPLEQAKPWNTAGITGVYGFMKKLWKLYHNDAGFSVSDEKASPDSMKTLHKTIKKVQDDIENFSFNTSVSSFMIAVNELTQQKCNSREVLEPLAILISPYAPHIAEELWSLLGHNESISEASFPVFEEKHLVESSKTYPISFNGKMKFTLDLPVDVSKDELEKMVLENEKVQQQLEGKQIRKTIIVPGKIVNFVVG
ncbi:MAG: class I tRNA ligase family protein, partial [Nonlabens sp.]